MHQPLVPQSICRLRHRDVVVEGVLGGVDDPGQGRVQLLQFLDRHAEVLGDAGRDGGGLGPQGAALAASATDAFTSGYSAALLLGAAVLLLGAIVGGLLAPARPAAVLQEARA